MQLIGNGLAQRGARVLAHFDFPGHDRDAAIFVNVNPGADVVRQTFGEGPAA